MMPPKFDLTLLVLLPLLLAALGFARKPQQVETTNTTNQANLVKGDDSYVNDGDGSDCNGVAAPDDDAPFVYDFCDEWNHPTSCYGKPTYDVRLQFVNGLDGSQFPDSLKGHIQEAAEYWSRAIVSGKKKPNGKLSKFQKLLKYIRWQYLVFKMKNVLEFKYNVSPNVCELDKDTVLQLGRDSILICVHHEYLGFDGLSGMATTWGAHDADLPSFGAIWVHSQENWNNCDLLDVAVHEIGHALGFINFGLSDFNQYVRSNQGGLIFVGPKTQQEWKQLNTSLPYPPLENIEASHWSTKCFQNEMMQTKIDACHLPLSRVTLAVFEDIGYEVNYDCADDEVTILHHRCAELEEGQVRSQ